jgi:glycosyltransferase involved in cell wall biosynthesis
MKIAFIEQESRLGGVEYTTLRIAQAMDKSKFTPVIICPEEGDLPKLALQEGLEVQIVPRPKLVSVSVILANRRIANPFGIILTAFSVIKAAGNLNKYLQAHPADIIITKGLLVHFYGGIAARKQNIPCIWYVQEEVGKKGGGGLFRYILIRAAQELPKIIVVDAAALIEQFGDLPNRTPILQVIYNGIDTHQFTPFSVHEKQVARNRLNIPANSLVIGQAGRIIPAKGQDILLDAFIWLIKDFPDLHLLFVGAPLFGSPAYELKLRRKAAVAGLESQVHFSGFVPDVRQALAAMDIFVHASVETDSPVSVLEAMSCGLPMVVSGVRGTVEMVDPDINAIVVEPGNSNALALALKTLIKSRQKRNDLGEEARKSVIQKFSLQASVTQLESLIQKIYAE